MPNGPANRRFTNASPFNAPAGPEPPAERYVPGDRVTHDRYGLGRVVTVEDDAALVIDFGPRLMRIKIPCARMTKLLRHTAAVEGGGHDSSGSCGGSLVKKRYPQRAATGSLTAPPG
jgi:hypothetical protein